jgi:hypothetical protein
MEKVIENKNWLTKDILLNPNHPLIQSQSLTLEQVNNFFVKNNDNSVIAAIADIYHKSLSNSNSSTADDIGKITSWAKFIFADFENNDNYKNINAGDSGLKRSILIDGQKKDAIFALQLYIKYLVKCSEIKDKINDLTILFVGVADCFSKVDGEFLSA